MSTSLEIFKGFLYAAPTLGATSIEIEFLRSHSQEEPIEKQKNLSYMSGLIDQVDTLYWGFQLYHNSFTPAPISQFLTVLSLGMRTTCALKVDSLELKESLFVANQAVNTAIKVLSFATQQPENRSHFLLTAFGILLGETISLKTFYEHSMQYMGANT